MVTCDQKTTVTAVFKVGKGVIEGKLIFVRCTVIWTEGLAVTTFVTHSVNMDNLTHLMVRYKKGQICTVWTHIHTGFTDS